MVTLKSLLSELLSILDPYKNDMKYFILKNTDEGLQGTAFSNDNQTFISMTAKTTVEEIKSICALGSLPYLRAILESSYIKEDATKLTIEERISLDKITSSVGRIIFHSKKMKVAYQAADPLLVQALTIAGQKPKPLTYAVTIDVNKETAKEFEDASRIYGAYDKAIEHCRLEFANQRVIAEFGERQNSTEIVLAEGLEAEDTTVSNTFLIEDVKRLLKLASQKGGKLSLSNKYLRLTFEQDNAEYLIMISCRKVIRPA